jgi:hypothetical protein
MRTIYIVPIEPIDQRYTKQWYDNIPKILDEELRKRHLKIRIEVIDGTLVSSSTTKGAFLDFGATNIYKATQVERISSLFSFGHVKPGDKFLVTDAWNFAITPIKYMSELLNVPVEIHSIWHAGNYDPSDILGMKMSAGWASNQERAWYYASTHNYFATDFHKNMFCENLMVGGTTAYRSGQPHTPIIDELTPFKNNIKENYIMFPHRYNEDKQPEIAEDLHLYFPIVITQKMSLSKKDYYDYLGRAKAIFSCSLHENLGISMMEGCLAGAIPIVPDRCSYKEMYLDIFKYPSTWTESYDNYQKNKLNIVNFIGNLLNNYGDLQEELEQQRQILITNYLTPTVMINKLLED